MLKEFYEYWVEPNKSKTKFRQELEKTWDLERRLKSWKKNEGKFGSGKPAQSKTDNLRETYNGAWIKLGLTNE